MKIAIPWATQSYVSESLPLSAQELINIYPEKSDGKNPVALFRTPGLTLFGEETGLIRGMCEHLSTLYAVIGSTLYSFDSSGTGTSEGTLLTSSGNVDMVSDGSRIAITDGTYGYFFDSSLAQITDTDLEAPRAVETQDGWIIFVQNDSTGRFQITDDSGIDPLDFATAEGDPDGLLTIWSLNRQLYLFGTKTVEVWWNSGDASFTFQRVEGPFIERGLLAQWSVAELGGSLAWLADDRIVYRFNGYAPERISTHPIETDIQKMTTVSDAIAFSYTWKGHEFYVLTFPTENKTYSFDISSGRWHRRSYWNQKHDAYIGTRAVRCYGKTLVGSRIDGKIYEVSDTYDENGSTIRWEMTSPVINNDQKPFTCGMVEVDLESGTSLVTGQGEDSQVMLQVSRDSGKTWSDEKWAGIGSIGDSTARVRWRRLGYTRKGMVFKLAGTDPVQVVAMGSYAHMTGGTDGD